MCIRDSFNPAGDDFAFRQRGQQPGVIRRRHFRGMDGAQHGFPGHAVGLHVGDGLEGVERHLAAVLRCV